MVKNCKSGNRKFFLELFLLVGGISQTLSAQEATKEDSLTFESEEVVVVGTRSIEKMIDVPYSVFRVDKKELSFGKKVSAKDVLADVPGLFLQSRYGNHDLRVSIRGFGTRSNSGVRGVRILQDGIPESEPDGETVIDAVDFTSLGGVEVVKGNLSSLYANAPGGVINFESDLYFFRDYGALTSQVGRFGLRQDGFKLGLQDASNRMFLTYNYTDIPGYRVHSHEYHHLVNFAYEGYPGPRSTVNVLGNFVNSTSRLPGSLTQAEFEADPFQANPLAVSQDFKKFTKKGRLGVRYRTRFGKADNNELELTGYGGVKEFERTDNDFYTFATRYSLGALARFTNRTQLLDRNNVFTMGMDYAFQSGPVTDFDNITGTKGFSVQNEFNESLSNIGFYMMNRFGVVADKLDFVLSSRYDRNVFARDIYIPFGFTDTARIFHQLTPKVGLNYKLNQFIAVYTSYGLGYDYPALTELGNTPLSSSIRQSLNPDLDPQRSHNFELGMKGSFINRGSVFMPRFFFDVTFFRFIVKDEIVPFVINQRTYFRNAGKTNRTGVEVGIKSHPLKEVELTTNYTYTHFTYDDYTATIFSPSGTTVENYSGNRVPSAPSHTLNLILNYEFEISEQFSGLLQWDCDYISQMYVNDSNTDTSPPYFYANILAGVNFVVGDISGTVHAGVNNIFDRRYVGFLSINDFYGRYYETGEPRSPYAGLKLNYQLQ